MEMRERKQKSRFMKLCFVFLFTVGALLLLGIGASAAPALSGERQFAQPNGVQFRGILQGDEFFHFLEAQDGSILTQGGDGYWYYAEKKEFIADGAMAAELVPSRARYLIEEAPDRASQMTKEQLRAAPFQYRRSEAIALQAVPDVVSRAAGLNFLGDQSLLVILVDFNDVSVQYESQWPNAVFGGTGKTVKTFYREATGGQINIVPARETYGTANDGVVRIKLNRKHPNLPISFPTDFASVVAAASAYVDFASYDTDNNGKIDASELHIVMVYAGYEMAYPGGSPSVWAHHMYGTANVAAIGKSIAGYTCMGERHGDHMAAINVFCHELGHGLGLPDLYCNDWSADKPLTGISIMGGGWDYLAGEHPGTTPVLLDAYCLEALGVLAPQAVPEGQTLTAQVKSWSSGAKNSLKIASGVPNEYFLIECRNKEGFDAAIDGVGGIAVYRVNTDNDSNLVPGRFLVSWLWLDPYDIPYECWYTEMWYEEWDAGNLFFSTRPSGRTYINAVTTPSHMLSGRDGYSWFRFDCLSDSGPSMDVRIQPDKQSGFYAISYDAKGGSGGPVVQYKKHGTNLTLSGAAPTRTGYTFLGWSNSDTDETVAYNPSANFTLNADTTLYAVWRARTYTITYNPNRGSGAPARQTKTHGIDLIISDRAPTRTGYDFLGWADSNIATAAQYRPGETYTADVTITLYAVWQTKTFTITYNANGGSGEPARQIKTYGVALTLESGQPTRAGYIFQGWAQSSSALTAQYQPGGSYTTNANITLYAVWKGIPYTVTLDANGGSVSPASINVTNGGAYSALPTPARGGHIFDGWYTADGGKVNKTDTVNLTGNTTLYARWTGNSYTVTLNANGGSVSSGSITVTNGGAYSALPTPDRSDYRFDGWYTAANGGTRVNPGDTVNLTGNTTLHAHWAAIKGIFGTNARWYGAWWHYLLFFIGFGFIWMWF